MFYCASVDIWILNMSGYRRNKTLMTVLKRREPLKSQRLCQRNFIKTKVIITHKRSRTNESFGGLHTFGTMRRRHAVALVGGSFAM